MKKVYYVECDSDKARGMSLVMWLNEKAMATFNQRVEAHAHMVERFRTLKWRAEEELKCLKAEGVTVTIDLYKFIVPNSFDIDVDNVWDADYEHELIDSRYLCGRY